MRSMGFLAPALTLFESRCVWRDPGKQGKRNKIFLKKKKKKKKKKKS